MDPRGSMFSELLGQCEVSSQHPLVSMAGGGGYIHHAAGATAILNFTDEDLGLQNINDCPKITEVFCSRSHLEPGSYRDLCRDK